MVKWHLILMYLFVLLFKWNVIGIRYYKPKKVKLKYKVISSKGNKLMIKATLRLSLMILGSVLLYNYTNYPIPLFFGGIKILADNGYGYPLYNNHMYPSSLYYNGVTYNVYQATSDLDIYAIKYTHSTNTWSSPVLVAANPLSADDHGAPSICIDNNQKFHVFYGCHASALKHAISDNAEDISAWTVQADLDASATYTSPISFDDTIYIFYRSGGAARTWHYRKSIDNGANWSGEFTIINLDTDGSVGTYAYICDCYDSANGRIHVSWNYRSAAGTFPNYNVYHAYFNTTDAKMYSMSGVDLGTTITKTEADANCLIVTEESNGISNMAMHLDSSGNPYIIWCESQDDPQTIWDGHFIYYTGSAWSADTTIISGLSQIFHSDFIVNSSTNIEGYFGVEREGSYNNIEGWRWDGSTWTQTSTFLKNSQTPNLLGLAKCVKDYDDSLKFLITEFATAVNDSYVYGNMTFRFETTLDFDLSTVGSGDGNYDIETITNNPGIDEKRAELCSIKGDAYDFAASGDCFKETETDAPYRSALASGGSSDKNTTTADRRRISLPGGGASKKYGVRSDFGYSGDFDIEIQMNLITFLPTNYTYAGFGLQEDTDNLFLMVRSRAAASNVLQAYGWTGGVFGGTLSFNTTDTELWFRITRASDTITAYYKLNSGDSWTNLGNYTSTFTGIVKPFLFCENGGSEPATIAEFSEWKLNSGTVATGGFKAAGDLTTMTEYVGINKRISTMTIEYANATATYTLIPQLLADDDTVLWTGSAIVAGSTVTYDVSDLGTIDEAFKVKVTWAGDGDDTSALIKIYGEFEDYSLGGHHGRATLLLPLLSMVCRVKSLFR